MIPLGKAGQRVSWGDFSLDFHEHEGLWKASGSLDTQLPFDPRGREVLLSPLLPQEKYYIDMEPDLVIPPQGSVEMTLPVPVGVEVFLDDLKIGEFKPRPKKAYLGEPSGGELVLFVVPGRDYAPCVDIALEIVNPGADTRWFDELVLNPELLTLFQHEGRWITEKLLVTVSPETMDVKHTDQGPGTKIIQGSREPEINRRFKRIARRLKDVI